MGTPKARRKHSAIALFLRCVAGIVDAMAKQNIGISKINPDLVALARPIDSLRNDDRNARLHGEKDLNVVKNSLAEYGQQKPIVILTDGKVIAGNGTLEAARRLGWSHIACVAFDSADEAKARAYAIVDNRSSDLSGWNFDVLSEELASLSTLNLELGFSAMELDKLLGTSEQKTKLLNDDDAAETHDVSAHQRTTSKEVHISSGDTTCPKCGFEFDRENAK